MQKNIIIRPEQMSGPIKPLHGVGGGPLSCHFSVDATEEFREAGIPFGRTHDIEYPFGAGEFVDIHCVFPDFDKDENDPRAYNFVFTDEYLRAMKAAGTEPLYRLGESIEHQPIKRHIFPPKSFEKWGRVCSHIIAHYNEGWADGFHMGIRYWEIWNEPDIPQCWQGTREEFFEFYRAAVTVIKQEHPDVRIGGPTVTSPASDMFEPFIKYVSENNVPIDFVSWHNYTHTPEQFADLTRRGREIMKKYGLDDREAICDEWNYICDWNEITPAHRLRKTAFCAAFMATILCSAQQERVDKLVYYDAQLIGGATWNNLFTPLPSGKHAATVGVKREIPYYVLWAWNKLYRAGNAVKVEGAEGLYSAAAADENGNIVMLLSNYDDRDNYNAYVPEDALIRLNYDCAEVLLLEDRDEPAHITVTDGTFTLPGNRCALVTVRNGK